MCLVTGSMVEVVSVLASGLRSRRGHVPAVLVGNFLSPWSLSFLRGLKIIPGVFLDLDETQRQHLTRGGHSLHRSHGDALWKALEQTLSRLPGWQVEGPSCTG